MNNIRKISSSDANILGAGLVILVSAFMIIAMAAPLASATSVTNNNAPLATVPEGTENVPIMEFTFVYGGDELLDGTISSGTATSNGQDGDWSIDYYNPYVGDAWDHDHDLLALDDDSDGAYTGIADSLIAGTASNGDSITGANSQDADWSIDSIDNTDGDAWNPSVDVLTLDEDGDDAYTGIADTLIAGTASNGDSITGANSQDADWSIDS
ncbi:hypothetical protein AKJ37_06160, partial [candidate division MSBL1 archaeon SCGC-AAA259I09]